MVKVPLEEPAEDVLRVAGGGSGLVPVSLAVVSAGEEMGEVESLVDLGSGLTLGGLVLNESGSTRFSTGSIEPLGIMPDYFHFQGTVLMMVFRLCVVLRH